MKANFANLKINEDRIRETFHDKDRETGNIIEVNVFEPTEKQNIEIETLLKEFAQGEQTQKDSNILYYKLMKMLTDIDFGDLKEKEILEIFNNPNDLLQLVTTEMSMIIVNKTRIATKAMEFLNLLTQDEVGKKIAKEPKKKGTRKTK